MQKIVIEIEVEEKKDNNRWPFLQVVSVSTPDGPQWPMECRDGACRWHGDFDIAISVDVKDFSGQARKEVPDGAKG